ncbi:MAG: GNAT family N-acetyltransferase [Phycisphaerae bacterium]|nr:GNAT family N-acetyltransferase [Phycisphaerae bacterium]
MGYALIGGLPGEARDCTIEFFPRPDVADHAETMFAALIGEGHVSRVESQSNDIYLAPMISTFGKSVSVSHLLFREHEGAPPVPGGASFRRLLSEDRVFRHESEPTGTWGVEIHGVIAATGGIATHYNDPFADLFMEVHEPFRRQGIGAWLVSQLRRECHDRSLVPAARCRVANAASAHTLARGGMIECGRLIQAGL